MVPEIGVKRLALPALPPDPKMTVYFEAGAVRIGVEYRELSRALAHLAENDRLDAEGGGERAHVVLARRDAAGDQNRLEAAVVQGRREPRHVPGRSSHVEPRDDARDTHGVRIPARA